MGSEVRLGWVERERNSRKLLIAPVEPGVQDIETEISVDY
jgi:hypothetical protein